MSAVTHYKFVFLLPVWGEEYTRTFVEFCLPLILTRGNLGHFGNRRDAGFIILTDYRSQAQLIQSANFKRLKELVQVKTVLIDGRVNFSSSHKAMTDCYILGIGDSWVKPKSTYLIFLTPDSFWSDGSFANLVSAADAGKKCVVVIGLRTNLESMREYIRKAIDAEPENPAISNRELVSKSLKHLHGMARTHNWLSSNFNNSWPSNIYWLVNDHLMLAHAYHMHPLMVRAPARRLSITDSIDGAFISRQSFKEGECMIVTDSDFILGIEMTKTNREWGSSLGRPSLWALQQFATYFASPMHVSFFFNRIYFKGIHAPDSVPPEVQENVDSVISTMDSFYRARPFMRWRVYYSLVNLLMQIYRQQRDYSGRVFRGALRLVGVRRRSHDDVKGQ